MRNLILLEKVKRLIEQDVCKESKLVMALEPRNLRLQSLIKTKGVGYFDDTGLVPELAEQLSQIDIRYMWAMLKSFNESFVPTVPFINQATTDG